MGRDYFTYASKISVSPEQFDKLLTFLEFESDGDKSTRQNLIDALEEEHWLLKADSAGILSFEMSDADDTDFDWERFAELAYFLDEGSYYESEADSNQIQGAYVFGDSLEYRLSELDASAPHQISILSTRRAKLRDPGSSANRLVASAAPASPDAPIFADLDTSYWKTRDKEWKDNRQKQWQKIEVAATAAAPEKRLKNMIKAFFLRGKMPNRAAIEKLESRWQSA